MNARTVISILALVVLIGIVAAVIGSSAPSAEAPLPGPLVPTQIMTAQPTPPSSNPAATTVVLSLGQASSPVSGTTIKVWAVTEDSRCPSDVRCIQAGRVRVALMAVSPSGSSQIEMFPGQTAAAGPISVTLERVDPYPISTRKTQDSEYRFTFTLKAR